jgi:hypothetical protein
VDKRVDNVSDVQPCLRVSGASITSAGPGVRLSAHNPEVTGSNPVPATNEREGRPSRPFFFLGPVTTRGMT